MHLYATGPIDFWPGTFTHGEIVAQLTERSGSPEDGARAVEELGEMVTHALALFVEMGWERDCREGPFFFAVPNPDEHAMQIGVALKQDSNGTTFIASPVWLPHINA
jgi:hypothetical protein